MNLMVYPGSFEASVFIRYASLVEKYDKIILAAPKGWIFPAYWGGKEDIPMTDQSMLSFEEGLEVCDDVLFLDTEPAIPLESYKAKIKNALAADKGIYIDFSGRNSSLEMYSQNMNWVCNGENADEKELRLETLPVYDIPVPIVFVAGSGLYSSKFEIQLALRENFLKQGYKIFQVGSRRISSFFGFDAFPEWVYKQGFTQREKIILLNRYFYKKYLDKRPDVFIVGIPGGIIPTNPLLYEEMGEMAFLISNAIRPDAVVLGTYAHPFSQEYFDELCSICKYRFGFNIKYIAVSNVDITLSPETHESEYTVLSPDMVEREYLADKHGFTGVELFSTMNQSDMKLLSSRVLQELRENL